MKRLQMSMIASEDKNQKRKRKMKTTMLRVLGVSGSMQDNSTSARATQLILEACRNQGAQTRMLDLHEADLPMFRSKTSHANHVDHAGRSSADDAVNWAQALVLVSPDYHGSMSGAMKNFLDHYWKEFAGKLFAYGCVSNEKGLTVMDQMRTAIRQCYGWSLPYGLSISGEDWDESGMQNVAMAQRVLMMGRDLCVYGVLISDQFSRDLQSNNSDTFAARYRG